MEKFKSFNEFINENYQGSAINEAQDKVWKFNKTSPGQNEIANFEFTARVRVPKGSSDEEVGNTVAKYVNDQLALEAGLADILKRGIPVMYTSKDKYRNDIFGIRQGVLKGVITVVKELNSLSQPFYDDIKLSSLAGFKPAGSTIEIKVGDSKIFDSEALKTAILDPNAQPNDPNRKAKEAEAIPAPAPEKTPTATEPAEPATPTADQSVANLVKDAISLKYGQQADEIASLQAILIALSPEAKASINAKGGPMGRFGNATAQSLATILGKSAPVKDFDEALANELIGKLGSITLSQVEKILTDFKSKTGEYAGKAVAKTTTGAKKASTVVTTPKGTKLTFL
jgi:hypothetical protein